MAHPIGKLSQIPPGEGRNFAVPGPAGEVLIAVFHARDGHVFATQAHCPHRGGPLADGLMDDGAVVCPLHDRTYDLRSGKGIGTDCDITVYPVRTEADGTIMLLERAVA
jgi:nitrite reductase (NADH) small subunit